MAEENWYWAEGDKQNGPTSLTAIARLVAGGQLGPKNLIWKEGMAEWVTIGRVPALMKYVKTPQPVVAAPAPAATVVAAAPMQEYSPVQEMAPVQETAPAQVGYYNPSGPMPPRAAESLSKHARPRGDIGDWPLDDSRVAQFDEALKYRKRIDGAASLFRVMTLLTAIAYVGGLIAAALALMDSRSPAPSMAIGAIVGAGVVYFGFIVLYYFAWKGAARSQAWAPLTMGILFSVVGAIYVITILFAALNGNSGDTTPVLIGGLIGLLIVVAFAYVSFRGYAAIGPYLRQPAWCQELLSKTSGK